MNIKTEKVVRHYAAHGGKNSLNTNMITYFYKSASGNVYVGTWKGLYTYNKKTDDFSIVPGFAFETEGMVEDKKLLWICTRSNGVFTLNKSTGEIGQITHNPRNKNSLINNGLNNIFLDSDGNLWFPTGEGLSKYNPASRSFKSYTVENGLPTNYILCILEDNKKNLWISTTKGLICFKPATDSIRVYTTANGLLCNQFNYRSSYKDRNGKMYFGTVKGLISFNPAEFSTNHFIPPVYLTGLQLNNKEIIISHHNSPLKKTIICADTITLNYNESTFSIDFAALSYQSPPENEYAYKMEGLDKQWNYLKTNRRLYFTQLDPGKYIFKVKASNNSGVWNEQERHLAIEILPPFWASKWAYLLYSICGLLFVYLAIHYYHNRVAEKNRRKMELFEHEKEKEMYDAKIEFFTNIAHEIKTPLTLIRGPMEKIMERAHLMPEIEKNLRLMNRNINRLVELTNQLLDFRKVETKAYSPNFVEANICELLLDIYSDFKNLADEKRLDYTIDLPKVQLRAYIDVDAMKKIFFNLFSNAIKYADKVVWIKLFPLKKEDTSFKIEIANDGYKIPENMKEKVFEPFFRVEEAEAQKGSGIGLTVSKSLIELHNGTIELKQSENNLNMFALTLPTHQLTKLNSISKRKSYSR